MSFFKNIFGTNRPTSTSDQSFGMSKVATDDFNGTDRSTVSSDGSFTTRSSDDAEYPRDQTSRNSSFFGEPKPLNIEEKVAARKAELEASRQEQIKLKQQAFDKSKQELTQQSDLLESKSKTEFKSIEKLDRVLGFFNPTFTLISAVPIVGDILHTAGEFIVKFKDDRKLIAIGDLLFKNTDQMFEKIAVMEKTYKITTPVTIETNQVGGTKSLPHEFIKLIELLEELYITLLDMVLTEQRVNLIAKQLQLYGKYQYENPDCGKVLLNFSGTNCKFNDKILAYIDSRQTIQPKIGSENANKTATSWVFSKLKKVGKSIYRYGVAGEMIVQLQQLNTLINTAFNIALSQYVLDVKDELEEKIRELQSAASAEVKQVEEDIGLAETRATISSVQASIIEQDIRQSNATGTGGKLTKKMRSRKTLKQQQKRNGKTHKQNKK